jgi:ribosomal protein S18 acetylase RimI-like enzyme
MNITKANVGDVPQLVKLINSAYRGDDSKKGWTTEADLLGGIRTDANSLKKLMNKPDAVILKFCNDDDTLLGCVYLEKKNQRMYLGMLTVSPLEQAKGIGKKLLLAAEKYAVEQNSRIIEMTVISVRDELIKWYQKHGYYITGETKPFPSDPGFGIPKQPLEFIVMQKQV